MSWITENPWPGVMCLSGIGLVLFIAGTGRARGASLLFIVIAVALYFVESVIVTTSEQLEANLNQMLEGFQERDLNAIAVHISPDAPKLKETADQGLQLVDVAKAFHIKDVETTIDDSGKSAWVDLRANGTLTIRSNNTPYHAMTRWKTLWKEQDGVWKLAEVHRLNPVNGEEIGVLAAQ